MLAPLLFIGTHDFGATDTALPSGFCHRHVAGEPIASASGLLLENRGIAHCRGDFEPQLFNLVNQLI